MVDVAELVRPRALRRRRAARATPASSPAATCSRPRTAPATSTTPSACARSSRVLREASDLPVVLPLHPRTRARLEAAGLLDALVAGGRVRVLPPLGYVAFTALLARARRRAHRLRRRAEGGVPRGRAAA